MFLISFRSCNLTLQPFWFSPPSSWCVWHSRSQQDISVGGWNETSQGSIVSGSPFFRYSDCFFYFLYNGTIDRSIKLRPIAYWPITTHCATEGPTNKVQHACAYALANAAELCREALERLTCSCSHVRIGRSLMDRSFTSLTCIVDTFLILFILQYLCTTDWMFLLQRQQDFFFFFKFSNKSVYQKMRVAIVKKCYRKHNMKGITNSW